MADTSWETINPLPDGATSIKLLGEATSNGVKENYLIAPEEMKPQMGLENVDNTSDEEKPISNATQMAIEVVVASVTDETTRAETAETDLQNLITSENTRAEAAENDLESRLEAIEDVVPPQASATNELATKDFVNSSISTNTAYPIGTFNSFTELEAYSGTLTNNDYGYVVTTNTTGDRIYRRYKWNSRIEEWVYEYDLNTTGYTAEQWAALNSGITAESVDKLNGIEDGAQKNTVNSINGLTGDVVLPGATVDRYLNSNSPNPVENKCIFSHLRVNQDVSTSHGTQTATVYIAQTPYAGLQTKLFLNKKVYATSATSKMQLYIIVTTDTPYTLTESLKVYKCGEKIDLPSHLIDGQYVFANQGTCLDLVFDGTDWVVMGNPEVITYTSDTISYRIKADGFIEQELILITDSNGGKDFVFPIMFTTDDNIKYSATLLYNSAPNPVGVKNTLTKNGGRVGLNISQASVKICAWFRGY